MSLTNCRFYEEKYPEVESFVMVNVKQIAEMGAYVKLLEYGRAFEQPSRLANIDMYAQTTSTA